MDSVFHTLARVSEKIINYLGSKMKTNEEVRPIDLSKILVGFEGMWIILSDDKKSILASGKTFTEISDNVGDGTVMKVPHFDVSIAPASLSE